MKALEHYFRIFLNLTISLITVLLCIFLLPKVIGFFMPFVVGWVIALIANPLVRFLEEKIRIRRKAVSAFVIIAVIAAIFLIGYGLGAALVRQLVGFVNEIPNLWESLESDFTRISSNWNDFFEKLPLDIQWFFESVVMSADTYFSDFMGSIGTPTVEAVSSIVVSIPNAVVSVIMCVLSAYFFIAERDYLLQVMRRTVPLWIREKWDIVYGSMKQAVGGYCKAQLKIEVWMYILLFIGLTILQVKYTFIIALGIAILDILPFFGTGAVLLPWAIVKFLSADYKMCIGLLIIWGFGQLARQIIQPKIVGDSIGMPPIPTLLLLFIGFKVGGVLGMIIAVPIGIIVVNLYQSGVMDNTKKSVQILSKDIHEFRQFTKDDENFFENHKVKHSREDKS